MAYAVFFKAPQTALGGQTNGNGVGYISTGSTTLTVIGTDKLSPGTAVTGTSLVSTDGGSFVADDFSLSGSPNQILSLILVNNSAGGYHNVKVDTVKIPTSPTGVVDVKFVKNGTVTINVFNTDSVKTTSTGTVNQTVAAGGAYNMKVRLDGSDKVSSQDMRCILESNTTGDMDKITLSGLGASYIGMAKPASYSLAGANSQVWVYDIAAVEGAVSLDGTVAVASKTSKTLAGNYMKITCKTKEYFLDTTTGKVAYDIEDSLGNAKSMANYVATVYFT
jgi:hypothetical protein